MRYTLEEIILTSTPFIVLLVDSIRLTTPVNNVLLYFALVFYSILVLNVQFIYAGSHGVGLKPLWLIPLMISLQYYIALILGYELSSFIVLTILVMVFVKYVRIQQLGKIDLRLYSLFVLTSIFAMIYFRLPYMPFVILGPIWEYLLTESSCRENMSERVPLVSFSAALLYNYNYLLIIYSVLASTLKFLSGNKIKYVIVVDGIIRLILLWVGGNAA